MNTATISIGSLPQAGSNPRDVRGQSILRYGICYVSKSCPCRKEYILVGIIEKLNHRLKHAADAITVVDCCV